MLVFAGQESILIGRLTSALYITIFLCDIDSCSPDTYRERRCNCFLLTESGPVHI